MAHKVPREKRRAFWAWVFKGDARDQWTRGAEREAARAIKAAIASGGAPDQGNNGHISLVGAGPGARDLLTLRAVERLQEADVIFYDRLVDPEVLELARRDAERIFVGKHVGAHAWPQDRICAMIVAEAARGRKVVRLKSGDPGIFGRATEELQAARAAGISIDIVPGVTAASAAGAALGHSLTERGVTDTLVIATGTGCSENPHPDSTRLSGPGTTTAFYMAVGQAGRIAQALMGQGLPKDSPVDLCANISKQNEHLVRTTLQDLPDAVDDHNLKSGAIILVSWPRKKAAAAGEHPRIARAEAG